MADWFLPCEYIQKNPGIRDALQAYASQYAAEKFLPKALQISGYHCVDRLLEASELEDLNSVSFEVLKRLMGNDNFPWALGTSQFPLFHNRSVEMLDNVFGRMSNIGIIFPGSWRIDRVALRMSLNNPNLESVQWHRDSVGHRLHLFLYLNSFGSCPTTAVVPTSNTAPPYAMLIDIIRAQRAYDFYKENHIVERILCARFDSEPAIVDVVQGSLLLMDTNCFHRAFVPATERVSCSQGLRFLLHIEMMESAASDFSHTHRIGPCAPGQELLAFTSEQLKQFNFGHLIDRSHLHQVDQTGYFVYSTADRLEANMKKLYSLIG